MNIYFKLLDKQNYNTLVRANGRLQYIFDTKSRSWVRSGIMLHYFSDESDTYNMFEEITEEEANKLLKEV